MVKKTQKIFKQQQAEIIHNWKPIAFIFRKWRLGAMLVGSAEAKETSRVSQLIKKGYARKSQNKEAQVNK